MSLPRFSIAPRLLTQAGNHAKLVIIPYGYPHSERILPMNHASLKAELRHELKLTPQLLQSMKLLQMNSQELLNYLNDMVAENPLLEHDEAAERAKEKEYEALQQKLSWLDCGVSRKDSAHETAFSFPSGSVDPETESLSAFLNDQLDRLHLPKAQHALCRYMVELLDEDGYWDEEDFHSLLQMNIPQEMIDHAVATIQCLEPAGIGARSLAECLLLQLERKGDFPTYYFLLLTEHWEALGRHQFSAIARALNVPVSDIKAAEKDISALHPRPGQAFSCPEPTVYIRPDLFIVELDGRLQVILNEYYLPRLSVSSYYVSLLQKNGDPETQEYLREKLTQARWIMNSLERRNSTLLRCAEKILSLQQDFFANTSSLLAPMTLSALAAALNLHPSTVSRAIRGKYIQCRRGIFPMKYFLSRSLGASDVSTHDVRQLLSSLIAEEDPAKPYSDQKLTELLTQSGYSVARRTVAKYREALGIPASGLRRH